MDKKALVVVLACSIVLAWNRPVEAADRSLDVGQPATQQQATLQPDPAGEAGSCVPYTGEGNAASWSWIEPEGAGSFSDQQTALCEEAKCAPKCELRFEKCAATCACGVREFNCFCEGSHCYVNSECYCIPYCDY